MIRIFRAVIVPHRHCVVPIQQIYSVYIANIQVVQTGECKILEENHENGSKTSPYGSVRAHIHTGWIPQALGSLWDASRALKRPWKIQKSRFSGFLHILIYFPMFSCHPSTATGLEGGVGPPSAGLLEAVARDLAFAWPWPWPPW